MRHALEEQNKYRVGGALWAFFPGGNEFSVVTTDRKECKPVLDAFVSPYARIVAGTTDSVSWNQDTGEFTLVFREDDTRSIPDPTVIFIPKSRHYPTGFEATVEGRDRFEWNEQESILSVFRDPNQNVHTVKVVRRAK